MESCDEFAPARIALPRVDNESNGVSVIIFSCCISLILNSRLHLLIDPSEGLRRLHEGEGGVSSTG